MKRPDVLFRIGMGALATSGLLRLFEHPVNPAWRDGLDGVTGFLTGIALATLLLSVWKRGHRSA